MGFQNTSRALIHRLATAGVAATLTTGAVLSVVDASVAAQGCDVPAVDLTAAFAAGPDGFRGADYQRAIDLPDGRRLWTFQDAFVARSGGGDALVHNVGVVQDGACFDLLQSGSAERPASWLA